MISVQILRAVAVLMVVLFHVLNKAQTIGVTESQPFTVGAAGVDLFFIISGFIMVYITNNRNVSFSDFISKRLIRILPLYWFMTTIAAVVYILYPSLINSQNGNTTIINSYTLFPTADTLLLTVAWTLRYEFIFYFIFSFSILLGMQKYFICAAIITMLTSLSFFNPQGFYTSFITNPIMIEFVIGMALYYLVENIKKGSYSYLMIITGIATLLATNMLGYDIDYRVLCYSTSMALIFLGVTTLEHRIKGSDNMASRIFKRTGDASFSIYLTHIFSIGIVSFAFNHHVPLFNRVTFIPISIAFSVIAGIICYEFIEKPLTSAVRRIYKTQKNKVDALQKE